MSKKDSTNMQTQTQTHTDMCVCVCLCSLKHISRFNIYSIWLELHHLDYPSVGAHLICDINNLVQGCISSPETVWLLINRQNRLQCCWNFLQLDWCRHHGFSSLPNLGCQRNLRSNTSHFSTKTHQLLCLLRSGSNAHVIILHTEIL